MEYVSRYMCKRHHEAHQHSLEQNYNVPLLTLLMHVRNMHTLLPRWIIFNLAVLRLQYECVKNVIHKKGQRVCVFMIMFSKHRVDNGFYSSLYLLFLAMCLQNNANQWNEIIQIALILNLSAMLVSSSYDCCSWLNNTFMRAKTYYIH